MNAYEMVAIIVVAVMIGRIVQTRYGGGRAGAHHTEDGAEARRLREEVRALKERIQVLERLATDDTSGARLDREIEALRDRSNERTRHD